jgi:hypothetical protein
LWKCDGGGFNELEPVFDIIWRRHFTAQGVEAEFLPLIATHEPDIEALQTLLAIKNEALPLGIMRNIEVAQLKGALPIIYELAAA